METLAVGYGISVIIGGLITYASSRLSHRAIRRLRRRKETTKTIGRVWWIPPTIGVLERILITTLVGFDVSGASGVIAVWIIGKSASGWAKAQKSTFARATLFAGLINSLISALFGVFGGLIIRGS